ncbi:hypothetical protein COT60_03020 [Candidatus Pacearchaeota archaeon CG09_land_8_20_14_0_10_30_9]|nr:hypothetical protein [Candidatus Pacearchaeota archaeon]OIO40807.1 MAG: hypothetical protein AUJ61_01180 [Candidatus Pacearchaeota archaeon CG1_02_30_18]PIN71659.1 MAG: hypothetical protein COV77_00735 [Candidatus Pacearchaeota archaeon CG11_big_fil_rev_8_21_14_0_20_30_13]PIO00951.1 MAG: hypothetical protein COT60_03020 [Candidatus Pacearchaeota archaeon CG09_land_8_20_14_0_10_30_9]PIZ82184.1 MAG: hypothetical protein COX98_00675 [Candidatus Pacearchaeota archaeon CG_4_10_14_0_2_um_filter_30
METKNTKGAMEMSVGTIVTIVLLMSVLVLGIFFISKIFTSSNNAINSIDTQIQNEINQMFSDGKTLKLAVYPSSRIITVKRGASPPQGFAFSIYNNAKTQADFTYSIKASDVTDCQGTVTESQANSYVLGGTTLNPIPIGGSQMLSNARLVQFPVPESMPSCTVKYDLLLYRDGSAYDSADISVTFK